jgi:hypothetical protein
MNREPKDPEYDNPATAADPAVDVPSHEGQRSTHATDERSLETITSQGPAERSQVMGHHTGGSGNASIYAQIVGGACALLSPIGWGWSVRPVAVILSLMRSLGSSADAAVGALLTMSASSIGANFFLNYNQDFIDWLDEMGGRIKASGLCRRSNHRQEAGNNNGRAARNRYSPIDWWNFTFSLITAGIPALGFAVLCSGAPGGVFCVEPSPEEDVFANGVGEPLQALGTTLLAPINDTHQLRHPDSSIGNTGYWLATYAFAWTLTFSRVLAYVNGQLVQAGRVAFSSRTTARLQNQVIGVHTDAMMKRLYKGRIADAVSYAMEAYLAELSQEDRADGASCIDAIIDSMNDDPDRQEEYTKHMLRFARLALYYLDNPPRALQIDSDKRVQYWLRYNARETVPFTGRNIAVLAFLPAIELIIMQLAFINPILGAVVSTMMMGLVGFFSAGPDGTFREMMSFLCCHKNRPLLNGGQPNKDMSNFARYMRTRARIVGGVGSLLFIIGVLTGGPTVSNTLQVVTALTMIMQALVTGVATLGTVEFNLSGLLPKGVALAFKCCAQPGDRKHDRLREEGTKFLLASVAKDKAELLKFTPEDQYGRDVKASINRVLNRLYFRDHTRSPKQIARRIFIEELSWKIMSVVAVILSLTDVMRLDGLGATPESNVTNSTASCVNQTRQCYGFNVTECVAPPSAASDLPLDLFHRNFSPYVFGLYFMFLAAREKFSYGRNYGTATATAATKLLVAALVITAYTSGASILSAGQLGSLSTYTLVDQLSTAALALILFGVADSFCESIFGQIIEVTCGDCANAGRTALSVFNVKRAVTAGEVTRDKAQWLLRGEGGASKDDREGKEVELSEVQGGRDYGTSEVHLEADKMRM